MTNTDITITSPSATKSKVDQSSVGVSKNDTITWINATSDVVIVFIPHDKLGNSQNHFFHSIQPDNSDTMKVTTSRRDKYRYAIFCLATNSFATGSDLEIIVQ